MAKVGQLVRSFPTTIVYDGEDYRVVSRNLERHSAAGHGSETRLFVIDVSVLVESPLRFPTSMFAVWWRALRRTPSMKRQFASGSSSCIGVQWRPAITSYMA